MTLHPIGLKQQNLHRSLSIDSMVIRKILERISSMHRVIIFLLAFVFLSSWKIFSQHDEKDLAKRYYLISTHFSQRQIFYADNLILWATSPACMPDFDCSNNFFKPQILFLKNSLTRNSKDICFRKVLKSWHLNTHETIYQSAKQ